MNDFPAVIKSANLENGKFYNSRTLTLLQCTKGGGIFVARGDVVPFESGDVLVSYPDDFYAVSAFADSEILSYDVDSESILDDYSYIFDSSTANLFRHSAMLGNRFRGNKINTLLNFVREEIETKSEGYTLRAVCYWYNVVSVINGSFGERDFSSFNRTAFLRIMPVAAYILENFTEKLSVSALAEKYYISESYLRLTFLKVFGLSPFDFIAKLKMEKAKYLLSSNTSVGKIAESVGYDGMASFNRYFRIYTGVSPTEYRSSRRISGSED